MLFKKYNVIIFRSSGEMGKTIPYRPWMLLMLMAFLAALCAGAAHSYQFYRDVQIGRGALAVLERTAQEQDAAILAQGFQLLELTQKYEKIQDFNFKLKIMMGLEDVVFDEEEEGASAQGGVELSRTALLTMPFNKRVITGLHRAYDRLFEGIRQEEVAQMQIRKEVGVQRARLQHIPSIWPTRGRLASPFGYRRNPFTRRRQFHKGLDIAAPRGTKIIAPADGVVTFEDWFSTYGRTVEITHSSGMKTRYAHMHRAKVKLGQKVKRGDLVGLVGNTGRSVASHLHYEVHKNGRVVNPMYYIMD